MRPGTAPHDTALKCMHACMHCLARQGGIHPSIHCCAVVSCIPPLRSHTCLCAHNRSLQAHRRSPSFPPPMETWSSTVSMDHRPHHRRRLRSPTAHHSIHFRMPLPSLRLVWIHPGLGITMCVIALNAATFLSRATPTQVPPARTVITSSLRHHASPTPRHGCALQPPPADAWLLLFQRVLLISTFLKRVSKVPVFALLFGPTN
jgi:hypothetical protein